VAPNTTSLKKVSRCVWRNLKEYCSTPHPMVYGCMKISSNAQSTPVQSQENRVVQPLVIESGLQDGQSCQAVPNLQTKYGAAFAENLAKRSASAQHQNIGSVDLKEFKPTTGETTSRDRQEAAQNIRSELNESPVFEPAADDPNVMIEIDGRRFQRGPVQGFLDSIIEWTPNNPKDWHAKIAALIRLANLNKDASNVITPSYILRCSREAPAAANSLLKKELMPLSKQLLRLIAKRDEFSGKILSCLDKGKDQPLYNIEKTACTNVSQSNS